MENNQIRRYIPDCFSHRLPREMWAVVLRNLNAPQDLFNCSKACNTWAALLEDELDSVRFHLALPTILPFLGTRDLVRCSGTCRAWNTAVDAVIDTIIRDTDPDINDCSRGHGRSIVGALTIQFQDMDDLTYFMDETFAGVDTKPVNPVIFRSVSFSFDEGEGEDPVEDFRYEETLLDFLQKCGSLIKELSLFFQEEALFRMVKTVKTILCHTPNLVNLIVFGNPLITTDEVDTPRESFDKLLHPMNGLCSLQVRCPCVGEMLVREYANQLTNLDFGKRQSNNEFPCARLPRLETLALECHVASCVNSYAHFFRHDKPHLSTLVININLSEGSWNEFGARLMTLLHIFRESVETLEISSLETDAKGKEFDVNEINRLRLPKCKKLILNHTQSPTLHFLERFVPSLETLILSGKEYFEEKRVDMDKLRFNNYLYLKHIFWDTLVKIKLVRVDAAVASRHNTHKTYFLTRKVYISDWKYLNSSHIQPQSETDVGDISSSLAKLFS